ncbi:hypothetical protein FB566_2358 [Stackebrandtia endophytica]|uniref:Uncharacterized protein n=1 Tax=Stackebrandtia endophytica TaxID=1496996 RepID=A0A543AW53_9ACTN|nr:hypothetical protein [Stackebrandtia endophytica]TQL76818.1 hypothetical protein FB566_2358 [Stackebrandtia endophytica]
MSIFSFSGERHWLDDEGLEPTDAALFAIEDGLSMSDGELFAMEAEVEALDAELAAFKVYRSCRVPARRRRRRQVRRALLGGVS